MDSEIVALTSQIDAGWRSSSFNNIDFSREKIKLDVFVTEPLRVDISVFKLWLDGYGAKEAAKKRSGNVSTTSQQSYLLSDIIFRDTVDQYRIFDMMEDYFQHPSLFSGQLLFQLDGTVFRLLIDKYYHISEEVMRELVGKKLNSKLRSSLDDLSDRLKVPIKTCRRQFDNLKRIYTYIVDQKNEHKLDLPTVDCLRNHFKLNQNLAIKYARYIFLCYHKIETTDKRLKFLSAADFEFFASVLMTRWTADKLQLDLDKKFKEDIRDCKTHLLGDKVILETYRNLTLEKMKSLPEKKLQSLSGKFQVIVKALLNIGAGISKSKEFEQIFEDLEEKVNDNFKSLGFTLQEVDIFFVELVQAFDPLLDTLPITRHRQRFTKTWVRYLEGIRTCLLQMFQVSIDGTNN